MNSNVLQSELNCMWDVDDTLVMHNVATSDLTVVDPRDNSNINVAIHKRHVKLLKDHARRGYKNFVWSADGYEWANAVVEALGIQDSVYLIMSKPMKFVDDLPANEVLTNRVYIPFEE